MKIEGGCLCGKVRYSADAEPTLVAVCHCKNCQKQSGSAFSIVVAVPKQAFKVEGTLKTFTDRGDSGRPLSRIFCPECGSPIISETENLRDFAIIKAGTLDDASWLKPSVEIFCDSAQTWLSLGGERQRLPKGFR